ncbi:hypothetical protein OTG62_28410, partial [Escherichia coli]|nr:hypothetical protein [Escherichia coli]
TANIYKHFITIITVNTVNTLKPLNPGNTGNTGNNKLCSGGCQHSQFLHLAVPDSVQINLFQPE